MEKRPGLANINNNTSNQDIDLTRISYLHFQIFVYTDPQ